MEVVLKPKRIGKTNNDNLVVNVLSILSKLEAYIKLIM